MARAAPAASRAISILAFLTAHPSRGFTISELVQHLNMNIASAHATLAVLSDAGFTVRDPVHRTYVLGPALVATGIAAQGQHPAIQAAIEEGERLSADLDVEVGISALAGRDVILLARRGPEPNVSNIGYPGDRAPLLAPIGAVFMAWADEDAVSEWLGRAAVKSNLSDYYAKVLADIRTWGFSVPLDAIGSPAVTEAFQRLRDEPLDEDAEHHLTEMLQQTDEMLLSLADLAPSQDLVYKTIAAPIFDPMGRVLLSISVTGPSHPVAVAEIHDLGKRLVQSATIATRRARGRTPDAAASANAFAGAVRRARA